MNRLNKGIKDQLSFYEIDPRRLQGSSGLCRLHWQPFQGKGERVTSVQQEVLQGPGGDVRFLGVPPFHCVHDCSHGGSRAIFCVGAAHASSLPWKSDIVALRRGPASTVVSLDIEWALSAKRGGSTGMRRALVSQLKTQDSPHWTLTMVTLSVDGNPIPLQSDRKSVV